MLTTGDSKQDIGVFESETAAPVSFSVQWLNMTRIELMKKDVNTQNPLSGAVYGIYTDKKCENLLMTMSATGTDGKAVSDYFDSALKTVYVKENGRYAVLEDGTIAASITDLFTEFKNLLRFGIDFETVLRSCTINPARAIGMDDQIGSIATGKYADLLFVDEDLNVAEVYVDGIQA